MDRITVIVVMISRAYGYERLSRDSREQFAKIGDL